jgi:hypothetical protein
VVQARFTASGGVMICCGYLIITFLCGFKAFYVGRLCPFRLDLLSR